MWRARSLAVLTVALAAPPGTTIAKLSNMLPHEVLALDLPAVGRRWVRRWLRLRSEWYAREAGLLAPWVALPPLSNGKPRMIAWGATMTLHRAGAPAWRLGEILRGNMFVLPTTRRRRTAS